ncbi:MAG: cell division protein FtsQ/DivIB, partial [Gemmatimonadota bacterium]
VWGPPALARLPFFAVEEVGVVGSRWVPPDEVVRRADVEPDASVWDDPSAWERRVEAHPLVREAAVGRAGFRRLEVQVREVEPVALVPGEDGLVPVDADGRALPLDPAEVEVDLPLLPGGRVEEGDVGEGEGRDLLRVLVALRRHEPDFVRRVSSVIRAGHGSVRVRLTEGQACEVVLLPRDRVVEAFRRVESALGRHPGDTEVRAADARFDGQVVLRFREAPGKDRSASAAGRRGGGRG